MRCIEIRSNQSLKNEISWLTLTWDVLKWTSAGNWCNSHRRLTLTWDVLKYNNRY